MPLPSRGGTDTTLRQLPLFPLHTILFPGGRLPLRIFEQRYIGMARACLADAKAFGVCRIVRGNEVLPPDRATPEFATVGTLARIESWDMPQLGILHVKVAGWVRFRVRSHSTQPDGLVVADASVIAAEPGVVLGDRYRPLARLLEHLAARVGPQQFPDDRDFDDASWVGYRLAELLPLPPAIRQDMLEIDDAEVRLAVLEAFLKQHDLL
jgi:Lon protease-like protein